MSEFEKELSALLNRFSADNAAGTPDFILSMYLADCLRAYRKAVCWNSLWHSEDGVPEAFREVGPSLENFRL